MATPAENYQKKISDALAAGQLTPDQARELSQKLNDNVGRGGQLGSSLRTDLNQSFRSFITRNPGLDEVPGFIRTPTIEVGDQWFDPTSTSCEAAKGSAPEGFRWEGSYDTDERGNVVDTCKLVRIEDDNSVRDANRRMAREEFQSILSGMGFTTDFGFTQAEINQLFSSVESWINDGWADGEDGGGKLLMKFRTSEETKGLYAKRFPGMKALSSRGQAMSEGEYIRLEGQYRDTLSSAGLPTKFYDSFDDYGRFIAGGVSPDEVQGRITAARSLMNPRIAAELQEYYGIGEDMSMAFMLGLTDEKGIMLDVAAEARNQQTMRDISRNIQIGGMAEASGFNMGKTQAELLAGTALGQGLDPFDQRTQSMLQGTFDQARRVANRETTLAGIDREEYAEMDTLQAAFGDDKKRLASERRAKRERARFSGSSGAASSALGVERNL